MGVCDYSKADYLPELTDDAIDALIDKVGEARSPFTGVHFCALGGAVAGAERSTMALELPDAKWFYMCEAMWLDPADADHEIAWGRSLMETMRPWACYKAPPNFISRDEGPARLRASYGEEKFERLVALKDIYDPTNVLALNQNIAPSPAPV